MWLILSLLTALFTSFSDVFRKKAVLETDVYVVSWAWHFFACLALFPFLVIEEKPPLDSYFFVALFITPLIVVITSLLYIRAVKASDLSLTMPILAFSPLFLLLTSPLILGEFPSPAGLGGIFLIVAGSYILNFKKHSEGYLEPFKALLKERGPRLMLLVALIYSVGANIDKIGVTHSSTFLWLVSVEAISSLFLFILMVKKVQGPFNQIKNSFFVLVGIGIFEAVAMVFQMAAIKVAIVPYVISIKRTSVIFTTLFGFILFKEKGVQERLVGVLLMIVGVMLIGFS